MASCRCAAVDGVVVKEGKVLLLKRAHEPYRGYWVLPGGFIEQETAEEAVVREVREETGLFVEPVQLIGVFSRPERDPRGVISIAFLCRVVGGTLTSSEEGTAAWFPLYQLPPLGFDHAEILEKAVEMLKKRSEG